MKCVCDVADKYGLDLSTLRININKSVIGLSGSTARNETITLYRDAFTNEEELARTIAHERFHVVDQLRAGMPYPESYAYGSAWERAAREFEELWWASRTNR
jgi:hypothetical protein